MLMRASPARVFPVFGPMPWSQLAGFLMFKLAWVGLLAFTCSCSGKPEPSNDDTAPGSACEQPFEGVDRYTEEAVERGITEAMLSPIDVTGRHMGGRGGGVVVQDMDADGDLDILIMKFDDGPWIYANDGNGFFELQPHTLAAGLWDGQGIAAVAAVDLDGDFLPEILQVSSGLFQVFWNQGDLSFSADDRQFMDATDEAQKYFTLALGDLDDDGDLDMVLPGFGLSTEAEDNFWTGGPDRILMLEDRTFQHAMDLVAGTAGSRTMAVAFTDRDLDGDLDLFVPGDLGPSTSFWRNDGIDSQGLPLLENDADEIGAALWMHAMGVDGADLNGDGLLDYCMSDIGLPKCLLSNPSGYAEGSLSLGIASEHLVGTWGTIGWSLDMSDMDNDSWMDMLQASGPDDGAIEADELDYADLFWAGLEGGGFREITTETGFGDQRWNNGLVTADVDGDGWLDILVAGPGHIPSLWMNRCGEAAWLEVELVGPGANTEAIGARVEIQVGERSRLREISSLRAAGQPPSRVHFGLGDAELVDELRVYWPDGEVTVVEDLSVRQLLTLEHPDAAQAPWLLPSE